MSPSWTGHKCQMQPPKIYLVLFLFFCMKQVTTNHLLSETTSKLLNFKNAVFLKTWFHQAKTQKGNTFVKRVEMGVFLYIFSVIQKQLKIL